MILSLDTQEFLDPLKSPRQRLFRKRDAPKILLFTAILILTVSLHALNTPFFFILLCLLFLLTALYSLSLAF